jgi:hypothetical protein
LRRGVEMEVILEWFFEGFEVFEGFEDEEGR